MKMFLLSSDRDALTGFRLAGVEGKLIADEAEFERAVASASSDASIGILLITYELYERFSQQINALKKSRRFLITQIPDSKHPNASGTGITDYVREAVGIKV